jgi:hypothetical protein
VLVLGETSSSLELPSSLELVLDNSSLVLSFLFSSVIVGATVMGAGRLAVGATLAPGAVVRWRAMVHLTVPLDGVAEVV